MKFAKTISLFIVFMALYIFFYSQLKEERENFLKTSFVDYTLPSRFTGPMSLEFKGFASDFLLFKFMTFIGGRVSALDKFDDQYWNYIIEILDTITDLDPYYWDAYLFSEMFLAWQAGKYEAANKMLFKARRYLTTDYRVPYYLGFNYFYFLNDNINGAKYLMEASKLPGSHYYLASLAARLSVYSFQHRVGIVFLNEMLKETKDERIIKEFKLRIKTLEILDMLEDKITDYQDTYKKMPSSLADLVAAGAIEKIPEDPYGGKFILLENGRVFTTSKMLIRKNEVGN